MAAPSQSLEPVQPVEPLRSASMADEPLRSASMANAMADVLSQPAMADVLSQPATANAMADVAPGDDRNRYMLFPIRYPRMWDMYKKQIAAFWTVEEVDLAQDHKDWAKLNDGERHFIEHVLAFFAGSDGIVNENLELHFSKEVAVIPEASAFYGFQRGVETIHANMYGVLIDAYIKDEAKKRRLFDGIRQVACVRQKAEWALRWSGSDAPFLLRLVAFACVEGIHFSGSFCAVFWLKSRGLMPGLCFSNELISRDEALHTEFAVELYNTLTSADAMKEPQPRLEQADVQRLVAEAVDIERTFVTDALPVSLLGINAASMVTYIEFVGDRLLALLGYDRLYGASNPFPFMNQCSLDVKTNFFERRAAEYCKAGVGDAEDAAAAASGGELAIDTANADF